MKKITLLSLVAATVLFTACGEETKEKVSAAKTSVTEAVKADTTGAAGAAKKVVSDVAESVKSKAVEVAEVAKTEVSKVADEATKKVAEAKAAAAKALTEKIAAAKKAASIAEPGKAAFAKCAGCHGADGKTKALGKSEIIAGQSASDLETKLKEYKAGTRNVSGMGMLMKGQVGSMDDAAIKAVSAYISGL